MADKVQRIPRPDYSKLKAYVVGGDQLVINMFRNKGFTISAGEIGAHVVIFTGGADISPLLYGQKLHKTTRPNLTRDLHEITIFKRLRPGILKVGICRGAQFLNVMCGGTLWQDVDSHTGQQHPVYNRMTGEIVPFVTSTHHQMMRPNYYKGYEFLVAQEARHKADDKFRWEPERYQKGTDDWEDVEGVYYRDDNAFCFQPHPEYSAGKATEKLFWECLEELADWTDYYEVLALNEATKKEQAA